MNGEDLLLLQSLVGTERKVRLTRKIPKEPRHNGIVLGLGSEWILLHQFHDFSPEGFTALRLRDITHVRSGEYERLWERMLTAEGVFERLESPGALHLDDITGLLKSLLRRGKNIIVQCEETLEPNQDFYIGQILAVNRESLRFANFDALGKWDEQPVEVPLDEITKLQFETPYVTTFSKYLERPFYDT